MIKVYQLTQPQNNFIVMIPFKGCQVEVKFEKGNVSKGVYARLYTNDKFVQRAVEASEMYGKIYRLVETLAEPGDEDDAPKAKKPAPQAPQQPAPQPPVNPEPAQEPVETQDPVENGDNKKEFANLAEALVFIANEYKIAAQSESEARKILKEHGILPVIKKG